MFVEEVQRWLETRARGDAATLPPVPPAFDVTGRMQVVWAALEEMEDRLPAKKWQQVHDAWTMDRVTRWIEVFWPAFQAGIAHRLPPEEHRQALDAALDGEVQNQHLSDTGWSRTVNHSLERIAEEATERSRWRWSPDLEIMEWCQAHALTHPSGGATPLARALVELRGRDAVEFVLAIGVELSVGPGDPWRVGAPGLLAVAGGEQVFRPSGEAICTADGFAYDAAARLVSFGIAVDRFDEEEIFIRLHPDAADLVTRVATEPDSRFRALARTLLDVERGRVSVMVGARTSVDRTDLHYARSVAHEIRNLLLPLSTAVEGLWEELARPEATPERRQKLKERITRSLDRLGEFATEAVKLSAAVADEEFALADVVDAAILATTAERNGRIGVEVGVGTVRLTGSKRDWTSVFVNLLRNAAQVRAGSGTVWVSATPDTLGGTHIYVDDDGPGVPEELRERVFDPGHSSRGGSGLGLAEARRTARLAGGSLTCEAAPQGGARFHFHLPGRA